MRLRLQQAFGHTLAQAAHRYALFHTVAQRYGHGRGGSSFGRGGRHSGHVFFQHTAVAARTLHAGYVHAFFGSQFGCGGHSHACSCAGSGHVACGFCSRGFGCGRSSSSGFGFGVDFSQQLAGSNGGAVLFDDFHNHTGLLGGQFEHNLVGFEVDQVFVAVHIIAHLLVPAHQGSFGNTFRQRGYGDFDNHGFIL